MKEKIKDVIAITLIFLLTVAVAVWAAVIAQAAPADVCPEEGKVESVVDGDLDDIVLDAGTEVCIFGASVQVNVTADGESTLRDLLGLDKNVSHYTVTEVPPSTTTTTTSIPETTTTTVSPTTTVPEETTTTTPEETTTTTIEDETSSTSLPDNTTTTVQPETTTTSSDGTTTSTSPTPTELPRTGASDLLAYTILALLLLAMGGLTLSAMRGKNDES